MAVHQPSLTLARLGVVVDLRQRQFLAQPVALPFVAGGVDTLRKQKRFVEPVQQLAFAVVTRRLCEHGLRRLAQLNMPALSFDSARADFCYDLMAIEYEGTKQLKIAEIDERLRENGIRVRLDAPLNGATACVIKEVLRDLLAERGFADAEVTQRTTLGPARGTKVKSVIFTINDGERSRRARSAQDRSKLPPAVRCNR